MHDTRDYWNRVRDTAAELGCDGCTMASGAFLDCCLQHDVEYRLGTTIDGEPITFDEADTRFRNCMFMRSKLGYFSPVAWYRYAAVKWFGKKFRPKPRAQSVGD